MSSDSSPSKPISLDIANLRSHYVSKQLAPVEMVHCVYERIASYHDKAVWIHLIPENEAIKRAEYLANTYQNENQLPPLFGIPFSVKDSIDVAGLQSTLACPTFSYEATTTAPVVQRILSAGGILIGKTNLDQFATGLAGVRSPYGIPRCALDSDYVSGGSSSGSAVSVAASLVSFTVCTDTGGSTRVPAALNGLVGLKPTLGTISAEGIFPACKNIDCVCVIARNMEDAETAWKVMKWYDEDDIYARRELPTWKPWHNITRFGIPPDYLLEGLSSEYANLFEQFVSRLNDLASWCTQAQGLDYTPFELANQALYNSSIVTQRLVAFNPYISTHGLDSLHPSIQATFQSAMENQFSAVRAYKDIFTLAQYKRQAELQFRDNIDILIVPSTICHFTVDELLEEPMERNKAMGKFSHFVNLLDLAAVNVPVGFWKGKNGKDLPFGVTVIGQAGTDESLMAFGKKLMQMEPLRSP